MGKYHNWCPDVARRGRPDSLGRGDEIMGDESGCIGKPGKVTLGDFLATGSSEYGRT